MLEWAELGPVPGPVSPLGIRYRKQVRAIRRGQQGKGMQEPSGRDQVELHRMAAGQPRGPPPRPPLTYLWGGHFDKDDDRGQ